MPTYKNNNTLGTIDVVGLSGTPEKVGPGESVETNFFLKDLDDYPGLSLESDAPIVVPWLKATTVSGNQVIELQPGTRSFVIVTIEGTGTYHRQSATADTEGTPLSEASGKVQDWVFDSANRRRFTDIEFVETAGFACAVLESKDDMDLV